jgi:hypothetical protein
MAGDRRRRHRKDGSFSRELRAGAQPDAKTDDGTDERIVDDPDQVENCLMCLLGGQQTFEVMPECDGELSLQVCRKDLVHAIHQFAEGDLNVATLRTWVPSRGNDVPNDGYIGCTVN